MNSKLLLESVVEKDKRAECWLRVYNMNLYCRKCCVGAARKEIVE